MNKHNCHKLIMLFATTCLFCFNVETQVRVDSLFSIPKVEDNYPHWSPDGKTIAFESNRSEGTFQIFTMTTDGTNLKQITSGSLSAETPVFSPDGTLIMFCSYLDEENIEIFLMNTDGSHIKQITDHPLADGHAKFSPNGTKIIFCSQRDDNGDLQLKNYELYTMNLDGTEIERLTDFDGWDTYPSFSPDGDKIAWRRLIKNSENGLYDSEVFVMNSDGTEIKNLTEHNSYDAYPDWSPDGKKLVFASNRHGQNGRNFQLFIMNADGSNIQQITWNNPNEQDVRPQWSPDGKQIIFNRSNNDGSRIYYLNVDAIALTDFFNEDKSSSVSTFRSASRGVAWGDYDGNGLVDLLVANTMNNSNLMYKNEGKGKFIQIVEGEAVTSGGWTEGVSWIDFDNDGDLDMFVTTQGDQKNELYRNDNDGEFSRVEAGDLTLDLTNSPSSCWCDYDLDGYLDVYVVERDGVKDTLFKNRGDGTFQRVSSNNFPYQGGDGRTCVWGDIDGDGFPELYVGNFLDNSGDAPAKSTNFLYKNNGNGSFSMIDSSEITEDRNLNYGSSFVDYDQDGDLDLFITNIARSDSNVLYKNDGNGNLQKVDNAISRTGGRPSKGHTWGDFDNDGDLDLFVANGTEGIDIDDVKNFLFLNDGGEFYSVINTPIVSATKISAGTAWADYDRDGDLDIFVSNWGDSTEANQLFRNDLYGTSWIELKLQGTASNYFGIGAKVKISLVVNGESKTMTRWLLPQTGYASQNEPIVHFGLGGAKYVQNIEIYWPSGTITTLNDIEANQMLLVKES